MCRSALCFLEQKTTPGGLPFESSFDEKQIPTKARPIKMNMDLERHCKEEIKDLETKVLLLNQGHLGHVPLFMLIKILKLKEVLLDL